jgi:hypothetical protein
MIRKIWINDHVEEIDVNDEQVETPQTEPTLEERVKATEDAILILMDMGV